MKRKNFPAFVKTLVLFFITLLFSGCTRDFYLSEKETAAYTSVLSTQAVATSTFGNLQGHTIQVFFDNSTGTPRVTSSTLLSQMRQTGLAPLETGQSSVDLARLSAELETQLSRWIEGRLNLYTNGANEDARLTKLESVEVLFLTNPAFIYDAEHQSIGFDVSLQVTMAGEIEVTALDWFLDIFFDVNGTYPLAITVENLRLQGEASIRSPFADSGRIRFNLIPRVAGNISVAERGTSIPSSVRDGIITLLRSNMSSKVTETFDQMYDSFSLPSIRLSTAGRLDVAYQPKADWLGPDAAKPFLHVVTRASDGKLYHSFRGDATWSNYSAIPFPSPSPSATPYPLIQNDPALLHSGNGQLEVGATDLAGDLVYAHYRDDKWGNTAVIKPNVLFNPAISYRGKPAIAASAPGQVEVVVVGSDGQLWHHRRINGAWRIPVKVPQINGPTTAPYRDPVAVSVGNKFVVVYTDAADRLRAVDFDLETSVWGAAQQITASAIKFVPAAVTTSDSQVEVVFVKSDGTLWRSTLSVSGFNLAPGAAGSTVSVPAEKPITGLMPGGSPILTCSTYKQPELLVPNTSGQLRYNRYVNALGAYTVDGVTVNPGWQGWINILDTNFFTPGIKTDGKVLAYSVAGTRTGKTEVVALAKYMTKQHVFHNEYESGRYGYALFPWKTVHWRGWEATGGFSALGTPAVAAVDRSFQTAYVGRNSPSTTSIIRARLGASNASYFLASSSAAADPIVLSSGIGRFDTIALDASGKPVDSQNWSDGGGTIKTLTVPAGVTLRDISAAAYGNGFIDLAASTTANNIYLWRYRNNAWTSPLLIATGVISAPVLMYTGAGQLELLGIDQDYRLYRWRFNNNAWQPRLLVASTFQINHLAFGPQAASSWGDGSIDVAVLNKTAKTLHHRRIGPGDETCTGIGCPTPRSFSNLGGSNLETPVVSAFSPTSLNILTMQGLRWYSTWSKPATFQPVFPPPYDPLVSWSGLEYIGADEMVISGAANTGRTNLAAIGIREGRVLINRYANGNWTGFQPIIGQRPEQILLSPIILPSIAAHGG